MSSEGKSYAVDSDLQGEIHSVKPKDRYHQDLHQKRISMGNTYVASSRESDAPSVHQKLLEKDRIIGHLEERISNLTRASQQAHEEIAKLSRERDEFAATTKKLAEDFSKVKLSKERNVLPATAKNLGREFSKVKLLQVRDELAKNLRMLGYKFPNGPATLEIGTCEQSVPKAYPVKGRPSKIDKDEFLIEVRSRLSDQQFSAFETIIYGLYNKEQTLEEMLRVADEIFGSDNKDLYLRLQGLLCWNGC